MRVVTFLLLIFIMSGQLYAQEIRSDSLEIKRKIAFSDGKYFKPTKQIRKAYRNRMLTNTSDYFNPTVQTVSNSALLKDSIYMKSYKNAAYNNSVRNIRLNRTIIISGSIIIAGAVAVVVIIVKLVDAFASALADGITKSVI